LYVIDARQSSLYVIYCSFCNTKATNKHLFYPNENTERAMYVPKKYKRNATERSITTLKSKNKLALRDKVDAIQWLFDDNDVYDLCCDLAGMSKYNIREMVINKIGADVIMPLVSGFYQPNGH